MKCPAVPSIFGRDLSAPLPLLLRCRSSRRKQRAPFFISARGVHGNAVGGTAVRREQACSPPSPSISPRALRMNSDRPLLPACRPGGSEAVLELKPLPIASNSYKNNQTQRAEVPFSKAKVQEKCGFPLAAVWGWRQPHLWSWQTTLSPEMPLGIPPTPEE